MKIRFTKQPSERSGGGDYSVGQVVDLKPDSAARWLRRGVAVEVDAADKETASLATDETATPAKPKAKARPVRGVTDGSTTD